MLLNRQTVSPRTVALGVILLALLIGILRVQAGPTGKTKWVPVHTKSKTLPVPQKRPVPVSKKPAAPAIKPVSKKRTGEQIYRQLCASCHGAQGQGGKRKSPLQGDLSPGELARFIHESMPPGADPPLPMADSRLVAEYIHGAFYSPIARERNKPARVELSRLTVRQYRNAITDLVGSFRKADIMGEARGLRARYFHTRQGGPPVMEGVDPEIRFDFGTAGAIPEQDDPYQFVIHWQGSVLAPDTGEYEFIVRTDQAAKLWVNDLRQPLVNAEIKSGTNNEYRASLFLLGGRLYPLRLEFYKGVTGVNNLKKLKEKPVQKASLALEWKMPNRDAEVIPQRCLLPVDSVQKFAVTTPFPPDDRSVGYERGTAISKAWAEATTEAAMETAGYVAANLRELSGVADNAPDRDARVRAFCWKFVGRAFRRPLADKQGQFFVDRQFQQASNIETAVKRVVLLTLKSPRFLYREIATFQAPGSQAPAAADPYDVASRLSFALWDSLPDQELLKAAAAGQLATREQLTQQAERMAADPRTRSKLRDFFLQWLKVEHYPDLGKDQKKFAGFDEAVAMDLRNSFELGLENVVWSEKSDFRELLLTDKFFLNGRLARMYGESLAPDAPFQMVSMKDGKRSGVLTHPYLLASFAYLDTSSPIHRGVLISRSLLGRTLNPPPAAFTPLEANLHPKLTTRQRVALQTKPAMCASCHTLINPLGFSLEQFDAIGAVREQENGVPVDSSGGYRSRSGKEFKFAGPRDLAKFLAGSDEAHAAFVEKLFQHTVKQPIKAFGSQALSNLQQTFRANEFNIRKQMIETAVLSALARPRATNETAGGLNEQPIDDPRHEGIPKT